VDFGTSCVRRSWSDYVDVIGVLWVSLEPLRGYQISTKGEKVREWSWGICKNFTYMNMEEGGIDNSFLFSYEYG
jgi:hypothetical protein